jgi:hypothetical protein
MRLGPAILHNFSVYLKIFIFMFAGLALAPLRVCAQAQPGEGEKILLESANRERAERGLQPLHWDAALAVAARRHAELMVERNVLAHQLPGEESLRERTYAAGARFSFLAENVAYGPTADMIHWQWMQSPGHRANILSKEVTAVGIAIVAGERKPGASEDKLFAVEDFSKAVAELSFEEQEKRIGGFLIARNLHVLRENGDARKACATNGGYPREQPGLILRFETSDLSQLPDMVVQEIKGSDYRSAEVGACAAASGQQFTRFKLAILFFHALRAAE